uniref:Ubiquitin carboxyl-terminal hydrolase 7 isoform X1 n=1 Tax=Rhizophora mucronata TaxID=61149 RepID=A0A2P2M956_RHIMU
MLLGSSKKVVGSLDQHSVLHQHDSRLKFLDLCFTPCYREMD